jgi:hypothetical protein
MVNGFSYFGGVPKEVLTDNMKTVVVGRQAGKAIWNTRFEDFAADIGFTPKVCRVRSPQTKGKVERLVHYVKDNFLPGRKFEDLSDLNRQALDWCRSADEKPHGTTGKIPLQELSAEGLQPLPPQPALDKYRWESRIVTRDGMVSFDGVRYGVPWQYSGKEVQVRLCSGYVEIYYGEVLLAKHKAQYRSGNIIYLQGQYEGLAERKGIATPYPCAQQRNNTVEVRELSVYDQLLGGVSGIAMTALKSGLTVYYTSLARLIEDLKLSSQQNRLEKRWRVYLRPAILIIDEVGYMQLNRQEAELLFRLISERYEHGSIILTSNKFFSDWGELLSDTVIATALLDRLLHHSHVINIRGQTYRLKDRLKSGVQVTPPANIPAVG